MRKRSVYHFASVRLYLPVLLVASATGFFPLCAGADNLVQTDRYTLTRPGPTQQQINPLNAVVTITFAPGVTRVGSALYELLDGSGVRLVHPAPESHYPVPLDSILMRQPLPGVHSQLGPMTLREALSTLGGPAWHLRYNELGRQVWFELNDHYRDEHRLQQLLASADPLEATSTYQNGSLASEAGADTDNAKKPSEPSQTYLRFPPGASAFNSLDDEARATLTEWLGRIGSNDQLIVTGESQSTSTHAKEELARARAETIAKYLRKQGISEDRIQVQAKHQNQASEDRQGVYLQAQSHGPTQDPSSASAQDQPMAVRASVASRSDDARQPGRAASRTRPARDAGGWTAYDSNHPAVLGMLSAEHSLPVMKDETLTSVMDRLIAMTDFNRLVLDITQVDLESLRSSRKSHVNSGLSIYDELVAIYADQLPELGIYYARDGEGWALVVSDRVYPRWMPLSVFDVQRGSVQSNLEALLAQLNWDLSRWEAPDYRVRERYPVVVPARDARAATTRLLSDYPLQARLNPNTQEVAVIPRTQPKRM